MWQVGLKRAQTLVFCRKEEEDILLLWIQQCSHSCFILAGSGFLMLLMHLAWFLWTAMSSCSLAHIIAAEEVSKKLFTSLQTWEASYDVYCLYYCLCLEDHFTAKRKLKNLETLWHLASWVGGLVVFNPWLKHNALVHKGGEENQCSYSMNYCLGAEILIYTVTCQNIRWKSDISKWVAPLAKKSQGEKHKTWPESAERH